MTNTNSNQNNSSQEEDVDTKNKIKSREFMYKLIIRFVNITYLNRFQKFKVRLFQSAFI